MCNRHTCLLFSQKFRAYHHCAMKHLLTLSLVAFSCQLPSPADDPELVSSLRFSPSAFDSFRQNTEIRYSLKSPVSLSLLIIHRDSSGREFLVRTLAEEFNETAGTHAHTWLGDTMTGSFAPAGLYLGRVQIGHKSFETSVLIYH